MPSHPISSAPPSSSVAVASRTDGRWRFKGPPDRCVVTRHQGEPGAYEPDMEPSPCLMIRCLERSEPETTPVALSCRSHGSLLSRTTCTPCRECVAASARFADVRLSACTTGPIDPCLRVHARPSRALMGVCRKGGHRGVVDRRTSDWCPRGGLRLPTPWSSRCHGVPQYRDATRHRSNSRWRWRRRRWRLTRRAVPSRSHRLPGTFRANGASEDSRIRRGPRVPTYVLSPWTSRVRSRSRWGCRAGSVRRLEKLY